MYTQDYSDLISSSQRLQTLLDANNTKLPLSKCQELIAKLYRFDSIYDAEKKLSRPVIQITKPVYYLRCDDLYQRIRRHSDKNSETSMWAGRTISLIDVVIETHKLDKNKIDAQHLVDLSNLTNLEKLDNLNNPLVQKYLNDLPGYRFHNRVKAEELHKYITMQIEYVLMPYVHHIENDILLYGEPGTGKSMWLIPLITNWIYAHPGKPVILLDIHNNWHDYIEHLQLTEPHLRTKSVSTDYFNSNSNLIEHIQTELHSTDIIHISLESSVNIPVTVEKWFTVLTDINTHNEILIVLDELHRAPNIVTLTGRNNSLSTYIYTTQNNNLHAEYELTKMNVQLTAPAMNYMWVFPAHLEARAFKKMVAYKYGYTKALHLLEAIYPYVITFGKGDRFAYDTNDIDNYAKKYPEEYKL